MLLIQHRVSCCSVFRYIIYSLYTCVFDPGYFSLVYREKKPKLNKREKNLNSTPFRRRQPSSLIIPRDLQANAISPSYTYICFRLAIAMTQSPLRRVCFSSPAADGPPLGISIHYYIY